MDTNDKLVLVWWVKEQRTSIVKITDVNEEDRHVGCISRVKFGKQTFPARVLAINSKFCKKICTTLNITSEKLFLFIVCAQIIQKVTTDFYSYCDVLHFYTS